MGAGAGRDRGARHLTPSPPPRLVIRRAARRDLAEAFRWYEERESGLGHEFLRAARVTLGSIERSPELYASALDDIRMAPLRRFPYVT